MKTIVGLRAICTTSFILPFHFLHALLGTLRCSLSLGPTDWSLEIFIRLDLGQIV